MENSKPGINLPLHCTHLDMDKGIQSRKLFDYCCLCGDERSREIINTTKQHGPYLRGEAYNCSDSWNYACSKARVQTLAVDNAAVEAVW